MIVDSHVHINHDNFSGKEKDYINEAKKSGVNLFLCVGWDLKTSIKAVKIANNFKEVFACVGIHPEEIKNMQENDFYLIEELIKNNNKIIAIGEIGLDFFQDKDEKIRKKQEEYFVRFINLANKYNLPVVIHSREADLKTFSILKETKVKRAGILHCCSLKKEIIDKYIELGFYFGFGGIVTFKNALEAKKSVIDAPLERIVLETDAPFLSPHPFRGKINHSKNLIFILKEIAFLKNKKEKDIEEQTTKNFLNLFNLPYGI